MALVSTGFLAVSMSANSAVGVGVPGEEGEALLGGKREHPLGHALGQALAAESVGLEELAERCGATRPSSR